MASAVGFVVKVSKNDFTSSMTYASSPTTMQVAFSSVKFSSNPKPRPVKNVTDRSRSATGRLTKIARDMAST
nr:hypothetical protein [Stackebrandtia albiflava]